jgi:ketosteroid isomerase-like protein
MSQENVEIARRAYEAFDRGDLEGMIADFAPEFEYVSTGAIPGYPGVFRGPGGLTGFVRWLRSEFTSPRIQVSELIEVEIRCWLR